MTNTMHRQGTLDSLRGDYIIFAAAPSGYNKKGSGPRKKAFLEICLKHEPVNMNLGTQEDRKANFVIEFLRERRQGRLLREGRPTDELKSRFQAMVAQVDEDSGAMAVFDSYEKLASVVKETKNADLGLCININAIHEDTDRALREAGIIRHSIEHSLGFHGRTERLPSLEILELSTMCGHGMVSFNLVKKMMDAVKHDLMTPERAAEYLMKPCTCGAFNPTRAVKCLREIKTHLRG